MGSGLNNLINSLGSSGIENNVIPATCVRRYWPSGNPGLFPLKRETKYIGDSYPDRTGFLLTQE